MNTYRHYSAGCIVARARLNRIHDEIAAREAAYRRADIETCAQFHLKGELRMEKEWDDQYSVIGSGPIALCNLTKEEAIRLITPPAPPAPQHDYW